MAILDDIRRGGLLLGTSCSVYEAAVHMMINDGLGFSEVAAKLRSMASEMPSEADLMSVVERLGSLVSVWKAFREIPEIAESFEYAKGQLVTVRTEAVDAVVERYLDDASWAIEMPKASIPDLPDDRRILREGLVSLAAMKRYLVRTRHLLGSVGSSSGEVDWFWESFGEFHHFDVIELRDSLVHAGQFDQPSSELNRRISWFSLWLTEFTQKIRRTSVAVPDARGLTACKFSTKEMPQLPTTHDGPRSAANALLSITVEHDLSNAHSLRLGVVSFDPETRVLRMPDDCPIAYAALSND